MYDLRDGWYTDESPSILYVKNERVRVSFLSELLRVGTLVTRAGPATYFQLSFDAGSGRVKLDTLRAPVRAKLSVSCVCLCLPLLRVWGPRGGVSSSNGRSIHGA
jgi:hypothetical protein